jgi:hypothetical protein
MKEIYKIIPDYPNYEASNLGNIRTLKTGKIRKLQERKDGYLQVGLYVNNKIQFQQVHRLIAFAWLQNRNNIINHIDSNRNNNNVTNLEWCDNSHNQLHAIKNGAENKKNEEHPSTTLKNKQVLEMRKLYKNGSSYKELSKKYNKPYSTIYNIINRYYWKNI